MILSLISNQIRVIYRPTCTSILYALFIGHSRLIPLSRFYVCNCYVTVTLGLLARAHKRLQVVYAMDNMNLPEIDPVTVLAVAELCNTTDTGDNCTKLNAMFACLAIPTNWKFHNDRVYMPYAWADEHTVGSSDDADSIKDIYWIQNTGNALAMWCYIVSGIFAILILGMFFGRRFLLQEIAEKKEKEDLAVDGARAISRGGGDSVLSHSSGGM